VSKDLREGLVLLVERMENLTHLGQKFNVERGGKVSVFVQGRLTERGEKEGSNAAETRTRKSADAWCIQRGVLLRCVYPGKRRGTLKSREIGEKGKQISSRGHQQAGSGEELSMVWHCKGSMGLKKAMVLLHEAVCRQRGPRERAL